MDVHTIAQLAHDTAVYLAPMLPYLVKAGEGAAGEVGKKFTTTVWERGQALWHKLQPKLESNPAALAVVEAAALEPDQQFSQPMLESQLKALLYKDEALSKEIAHWWEETKATGVTVTQSGNRNVSVIGNVTGNITTGDNNKS